MRSHRAGSTASQHQFQPMTTYRPSGSGVIRSIASGSSYMARWSATMVSPSKTRLVGADRLGDLAAAPEDGPAVPGVDEHTDEADGDAGAAVGAVGPGPVAGEHAGAAEPKVVRMQMGQLRRRLDGFGRVCRAGEVGRVGWHGALLTCRSNVVVVPSPSPVPKACDADGACVMRALASWGVHPHRPGCPPASAVG